MIYSYSSDKPLTIERFDNVNYGSTYCILNFDITETEEGWRYIQIPMFDSIRNRFKKMDNETRYGAIVDHILTFLYRFGSDTAIISNYLLEPENEKYKKEFSELQEMRKKVKEFSKYIIDNELI